MGWQNMKTMYMVGIALLLLLGLAGFAGYYNGGLRLTTGSATVYADTGAGGTVR
jgi:hypothetical protein